MFEHILSSRACSILEVDAETAVRGQLAQPPNSQIEAQSYIHDMAGPGLEPGSPNPG